MFFNKKKILTGSEKSPSGSVRPTHSQRPPPAPLSTEPSIDVSSMEELEDAGYGRAGSVVGDWLALGPNESRRSKSALRVAEGDVYELRTKATNLASSNEDPANGFFCGPIFYNANEEIVQYWTEQKPFGRKEKNRDIVVRSIAPSGAVTVRIGLHGSWSATGSASNFTVGFGRASLKRQ